MNRRIFSLISVCTVGIVVAAGPAAGQCGPHHESAPADSTVGMNYQSCSWDADGSGPNPPQLVIVGQCVGDSGPAKIMRWDGQTVTTMCPGFTVNDSVFAAVDWDGVLVVGGRFHYVEPSLLDNVGFWSGSSWHPLGPGLQGWFEPYVWTLAVYEGQIVAGGRFDYSGTSTLGNIARWDGQAWQPMGHFNGIVNDLEVHDGSLVAVGEFTEADGVPVRHIARWDGHAWQPIGPGVAIGEDATVWRGLLVTFDASVQGEVFAVQWNDGAWVPMGGPIPTDALGGRLRLCAAGDDLYASCSTVVSHWDDATHSWIVLDVPGIIHFSLDAFGPELVLTGGAGDVLARPWGRWLQDAVPWICVQPLPVTSPVFRTVSLHGLAWTSGYAEPITYAWTRDGVPVVDGPAGASPGGGVVSGAQSPTLTIDGVRPSDAGAYRMVVANGCGDRASEPAALVVTNDCATDINHDGVANSTDVSDFINLWFQDQLAGTLEADWDANGVSNSTDVSAFINDWFEDTAAGCG
jgi:hypothetical protein